MLEKFIATAIALAGEERERERVVKEDFPIAFGNTFLLITH